MISVIVPVYNIENYLSACLDSILMQSFSDFELLLINDGSNDRSGAICDEYVVKDARISVFHKENGGVTAARRDGVNLAKGEWIIFVDGDDTLPHDALQNLVNKSAADVAIVAGAYNVYDRGKLAFVNRHYVGNINHRDYISLYLRGQVAQSPWGKLFRKYLFDDFSFSLPREINNKEDTIMNLRIAINNTDNVCMIEDIIYNYTLNRPNSARTEFVREFDWDYELMIIQYEIDSIHKKLGLEDYTADIANLYWFTLWRYKKHLFRLTTTQYNSLMEMLKFARRNKPQFSIKLMMKGMLLNLFLKIGRFRNVLAKHL